jgi:pilus assembly protein Flp/PilA
MKKQSKHQRRRGQGMTEYILIVSLIAIASIGVATLFGNNVRTLFGIASNALAGDDNVANTAKHSSQQLENKTMKTFGQYNGGLP